MNKNLTLIQVTRPKLVEILAGVNQDKAGSYSIPNLTEILEKNKSDTEQVQSGSLSSLVYVIGVCVFGWLILK